MSEGPSYSADKRLPVDAFCSVVSKIRQAKPTQIRGAMLKAVMRPGAKCWLCGQPAVMAEPVIPERAGGAVVIQNMVPVCAACRRERGARDALEWAEEKRRRLSVAQLQYRDEALAFASQHPVLKKYTRSMEVCREHLSQTRWTHARVPVVFALGSADVFVACAVPASAYSVALLLSARQAGGEVLTDGVMRLPVDTWESWAREWIEHHAVFNRVRVPGDAPGDPEWSKVYGGIAATRAAKAA